jgi:hypothetical protein
MPHDYWKDVFKEAETEAKSIDRVALLTAATAVAIVIGFMFGAFLLFQLHHSLNSSGNFATFAAIRRALSI